MRMIDGDALIKALIRKEPFSDCARVVIAECIEEVRHAPTIEERKNGKWIRETKHHKDDEQEYYYYEEHCSNCGVKRKIGWRDANFCPNCGALMGGTP